MDTHTGEHPRIGAVDVIPFVPLGGDDDGRLRRARPRLRASGSPTRFDLPGLPLRQRRRRARSGSSSPTCGAASTRGSRQEIDAARPRARLRPGATPPVGRRGRRRRPAVPDRLQHQPRLATTSSWPSGSPGGSASPAAACPKVQANGFWIEELGRAQVSMNLLDFTVTPLWLVWETVREVAAEDGVELAESELIGLAPLAAFLAVADRAGAPTEDTDRAPAGASPPATCGCATSRRCRRSSCGSRRPAPVAVGPARTRERRSVPGHRGRPERRADARPPDRRGGRGRDHGRRRPDRGPARATWRACRRADAGGPDAPDAPVVACWEGRIAAVGPRADVERVHRGGGLPARPVRPARRGRRHGHAGPRRPAHPPAVRRVARGRDAAAPARRRLPRDPGRRRRDPLDGRGDARRVGRRSCSPTADAGSTRCSATA